MLLNYDGTLVLQVLSLLFSVLFEHELFDHRASVLLPDFLVGQK